MTESERKETDAALEHFTEYFVRNYPGPTTIIHDPYWHAPKIFRAACYALEAARAAAPASIPEAGIPATTSPDVKSMVDRFLCWPLPKTLAPDCGISFKQVQSYDGTLGSWPVGTNLFSADEARAMFEHCVAPSPVAAPPAGWRTVPVAATNEMTWAASDYLDSIAHKPKGMWWFNRMYQAMLDAAPVPPSAQPVCYSTCERHKGMSYTMYATIGPAIKTVCPICNPPSAPQEPEK